jgi:hypothetical protein
MVAAEAVRRRAASAILGVLMFISFGIISR